MDAPITQVFRLVDGAAGPSEIEDLAQKPLPLLVAVIVLVAVVIVVARLVAPLRLGERAGGRLRERRRLRRGRLLGCRRGPIDNLVELAPVQPDAAALR